MSKGKSTKRELLRQLLISKAEKHEPPMNMTGVANTLNISLSSLSHKLDGRRDISLEEAHAMAQFMEVSLDLFYEIYSN